MSRFSRIALLTTLTLPAVAWAATATAGGSVCSSVCSLFGLGCC